MTVCSLSGGRMEEQYLAVVKKHSQGKPGRRGCDSIAELFAKSVAAMETKETRGEMKDILGDLYQGGITYGEAGQYFSPEPIARMMAALSQTAKQSRLEVRFSTQPIDLQKGSVEFRVSVAAGDDELAYRQLSHSGKHEQSLKFSVDDFQDLSDDSQFEAHVRVTVLGIDDEIEARSEEFLLRFGEQDQESGSSSTSAKRVRSLVEGAIMLPAAEDISRPADLFDADTQNSHCYHVDEAKGLKIFRSPNWKASFSVSRPSLIRLIELLEVDRPPVGRWSVRVRADGSRVGDPEFHEISRDTCTQDVWDRLLKTVKRLCDETRERGGFWGRIWSGNLKPLEDTINAWSLALDEGSPELSLAETVEVQTQSGPIPSVNSPSGPRRAGRVGYRRMSMGKSIPPDAS